MTAASHYGCGLVLAIWVQSVAAANPPDPESDPALKPPPIHFDPGPEYAGSKRIFQGIPGIERAPNGRLWATWYGGGPGEGPHNYVMLATSGDDGKTWTDVLLVIDPPGDVRAFDPCLWHDPTGKLWLFWTQGHSLWDGRAGVWAITTTESESATPTWSEPRRIADGIMMNKPTVLNDGTWLLPAAIWSHKPIHLVDKRYAFDLKKKSGSGVVRSTDNGKTFEWIGRSDVEGRSCDEHMIVELPDGRLWMLVRTKYGIGESFSTDGGRTWSEGRPAATVKHIDSAARFFIRRLASGKLLFVKHAPPGNHGRSHLTAFLSDDHGKTWKGGLLLDERSGVSYPDGVQAPDGTIYLTYDYSRHGHKKILMATFTEKDVLAGRCVSEEARLRVLVNQATGKAPPKVKPSDKRSNKDGEPLLKGPRADFEAVEGRRATFRKGATLFTNRSYKVVECPPCLEGKTFVLGSIDRVRAVCAKAGVAYVVTPRPDRNKDSVEKALQALGFERAAVPEFLLFGRTPAELCSVYQKRVKEGEKVELGKWGVLVF